VKGKKNEPIADYYRGGGKRNKAPEPEFYPQSKTQPCQKDKGIATIAVERRGHRQRSRDPYDSGQGRSKTAEGFEMKRGLYIRRQRRQSF